jgi:hypothetical protein
VAFGGVPASASSSSLALALAGVPGSLEDESLSVLNRLCLLVANFCSNSLILLTDLW